MGRGGATLARGATMSQTQPTGNHGEGSAHSVRLPPEVRSFDPHPPKGIVRVKFDPIPDDPDIADAVKSVHQLHECVEQHRLDDRKDHRAISRRVGRIERQVAGIAKAVGVDAKGARQRKTLLTMSQLELFSKFSGLAFGVILLIQFGNAVAPGAWVAARAAWTFILHGAR